jgi:hypothetical protein
VLQSVLSENIKALVTPAEESTSTNVPGMVMEDWINTVLAQ